MGDRVVIYSVEKLFKGDTLLRQDEECCFMSFLVTEFLCFHQLTEKGEEIKKKGLNIRLTMPDISSSE